MIKLRPVVAAVLATYALPIRGVHGVAHWARVLENGLRVAEAEGADTEVVSLFAVLHDARRVNEGTDPEHGPRAAAFAAELRGAVFDVDDKQFDLLTTACEGHTHCRFHDHPTVQACWDADRLDIGRVGVPVLRAYLNTATAKTDAVLKWADGRAALAFVPDFLSAAWGVDIDA